MKAEIYKMTYKVGSNTKVIRLLGKEFIKNNRNKVKLIINNKKYKINNYISSDDIEKNKIKIILNKNICNISCMFKNCKLLDTVSQLTYLNGIEYFQNEEIFNYNEYKTQTLGSEEMQENSNSFSYGDNLFNYKMTTKQENLNFEISNKEDEISIKSFLLDLNYNSNNLGDNYMLLEELFSNCELLTSLPDISKWNTDKVTDMRHMFSNCKSLLSIPDISKWNTSNVKDISYMFSNCESLLSIADISKWNINNVIDLSHIFHNCKSLSFLPDISKWNTSNVKDINNLFSNCESLIALPDISK